MFLHLIFPHSSPVFGTLACCSNSALPHSSTKKTYLTHKSRRPEGSSPSAVDIDSLLALVMPSASASTAPETAPEEPIRYPSTVRLTNMMWCQEDEDDEAEGANEVNIQHFLCCFLFGFRVN